MESDLPDSGTGRIPERSYDSKMTERLGVKKTPT
jgi:hypothetical protein